MAPGNARYAKVRVSNLWSQHVRIPTVASINKSRVDEAQGVVNNWCRKRGPTPTYRNGRSLIHAGLRYAWAVEVRREPHCTCRNRLIYRGNPTSRMHQPLSSGATPELIGLIRYDVRQLQSGAAQEFRIRIKFLSPVLSVSIVAATAFLMAAPMLTSSLWGESSYL